MTVPYHRHHTGRTRVQGYNFMDLGVVAGATAQDIWAQSAAGVGGYVYLALTNAGSDLQDLARGMFVIPQDFASGLSLTFLLAADGVGAADNMVLTIRVAILSGGDSAEEASETTNATIAMLGTAHGLTKSTVALTITNPQPGDMVRLSVGRLPTDASDVYTGTARLLNGYAVEYTADA